MSEITLQQIHEAVKENRSAFEEVKKGHISATEKLLKTEEFIDKSEKKSEELTKQIIEANKKAEEFKEKFDELEKKFAKGGLSANSDEYREEKSAFNIFVKRGEKGMTDLELKTLNTESGIAGGYLVPTPISNEIAKKIIEMSDVRAVARTMPMGKLLRQPIRSTLVTSGWKGEMQTGISSQSTYAQKELVAKTLMVTVPITREELEDSAFDMTSQISSDVAIEFARKEGEAFVNGGGTPTVPQGFMTDADVQFFNSGVADDITFDSILNLPGELKVGYNPIWAFNRRTRARIRQLKDSVGNYLWQVGNVAAGVPNQLDGYNYASWINMPDIGAGTFPIVFGDFYRGYYIGDTQGMFVIRDDYTQKTKNIVEFTFSKRTDGIVVLSEALKKIKCSE